MTYFVHKLSGYVETIFALAEQIMSEMGVRRAAE